MSAIGPGDWVEAGVVACDPNSGCWLWARSMTAGGYGRIGDRYAHRASFEAFNRSLKPGEVVCHKCDTPACVNPAHLFAGTQRDNMQDAHSKGRLNDPNAVRSTELDVIADIKAALARGVQGRVLALDYGISQATVSAIKTGKRWAHVRPRASLIESLKTPAPATEDA